MSKNKGITHKAEEMADTESISAVGKHRGVIWGEEKGIVWPV